MVTLAASLQSLWCTVIVRPPKIIDSTKLLLFPHCNLIECIYSEANNTYLAWLYWPIFAFLQNVVLTCGSGVRASLADGILQRFGYSHLRIFYGSFDDWKANNGTVEEVKLDVDYEN